MRFCNKLFRLVYNDNHTTCRHHIDLIVSNLTSILRFISRKSNSRSRAYNSMLQFDEYFGVTVTVAGVFPMFDTAFIRLEFYVSESETDTQGLNGVCFER